MKNTIRNLLKSRHTWCILVAYFAFPFILGISVARWIFAFQLAQVLWFIYQPTHQEKKDALDRMMQEIQADKDWTESVTYTQQLIEEAKAKASQPSCEQDSQPWIRRDVA
jgi:hypothetical protein